jgi:hypothetical protein
MKPSSSLLFAAVAAMTVCGATTVSAWMPSGALMVAVRPNHYPKRRFVSYDTSLESAFVTAVLPPSPPLTEAVHMPPLGETVKEKVGINKASMQSAFTTVIATSLTFVLNNFAGMGPVNASMVTTMLATLMLPERLSMGAVLGSYAGMANTAVIPGFGSSVLLGGAGAAIMQLFDRKNWFYGVGGRLSFIAQCACTLHFMISAMFFTPAASAGIFGPFPSIGNLMKEFPRVAIYTAIGALFMSLWNEVFPTDDSDNMTEGSLFKRFCTGVVAVAPTGLLAALPVAAVCPAFCGSFIAMSTPCKLSNDFRALLGASLMGAVCQQSLSGFLIGGWAGRLGTASVMAVLSFNAVVKTFGLAENKPYQYVRPVQVSQPVYVTAETIMWSRSRQQQPQQQRGEYAYQYQAS